eukprot:515365-Hanusia_phi.AAC.1
MLENLRRKAEKRLKKDVQARETEHDHRVGVVRVRNVTMRATDDGEFVPEDTMRAIAAAGGYDTVDSWEEARSKEEGEREDGKKRVERKKKQSTKLVQRERKEERKVEAARSRGKEEPNMLENIGKWIASKFHANDVQILAGRMKHARLRREREG